MNRTVVALAAGIVLCLGAAAPARAQAPASLRTKEDAAREILRITGAANMSRQMLEQMRPSLEKAVPGIPSSFWDDFLAEVKTDELFDTIVPIYSRHFSLEELEQLIEFYKTPVGRKLIGEMPAVMSESMAAGQVWGRELALRAQRKAEARRAPSKD